MTGAGELAARIGRLNTAYAHAIDDDRLEDWPGFFTDDGLYRIVTRENHEAALPLAIVHCAGAAMMRDRVRAMRTANIFEPHSYCHTLGAAEPTGGGDGVHAARTNFIVVRTMHSGAMSVFACGRYLDRIVERDGALKLAERVVVCDSRTIDTLLVVPL
ncbi:MAG: aromatic-ring-hydroxylating dioxygenase subunit beta [Defluviicoccus sp.]|nr:aromatic-ring-hydroxylating dioxygenase subunit beta [Defluviicoccus sp.]MDE0383949.1 aromatic-ring-hydroxylating dioxygenase subunit beta [Defluviicoccus sp.]